MPISTADLTQARTTRHRLPGLFLDAWPRLTVATASINQQTFGYPLGELTVDNVSAGWVSDVEVGMLYEITDSNGDLITTGTVRKATTSTKIYIDGKSLGDTGKAVNIANPLDDDQTVTIYNFYPIWSLLSRIVNGAFIKQFDIPYTDQGSNGAPVCNIGDWGYAVVEAPSSRASFTYTTLASETSNPAASYALFGKSITSTLWTLPAEARLTAGSLTGESVTFNLPIGFYILKCQITDNGGASTTAIRPIWVRDRYGGNSLGEQFSPVIGSDSQNLSGRSKTITLTADPRGSTPDLLDGAALIWFEEARYGGQALSSGVVVDKYVGFVSNWTQTGNLNSRSVTLNLKSPYDLLSEVPMVAQAIIEKTSPANWTQILSGYGDPNTLIWYVLSHHCPNALKLFDFHRILPTPERKRRYALNGQSVKQQLEEITGLITGSNLGSASDGSLFFLPHPNVQDNDFRNNMDDRMELAEGDVRDEITFDINYRVPLGQLILFAFALQNNQVVPLGSIAPGRAQGQGVGRTQGQDAITVDQDTLNRVAGHWLRMQNAKYNSWTAKLKRNLDFADPARHFNSWFSHDFDSRYHPFGQAYTGRNLVTEVRRRWEQTDSGYYLKHPEWTLIPETYGQPGEIYPIKKSGAGQQIWDIQYPVPEVYDNTPRRFAFAHNDQGRLARTFSLGTATAWTPIDSGITGNVNDWDWDYFSTLPASGWLEGLLGLYAVSTLGNQFYIWKATDSLGTVSWSLKAQYAMADSTCETAGRIVASKDVEGLVVAAWHDRSGVTVVTSEDGGETWAKEKPSGVTTAVDLNNDDRPIALVLVGQQTLVTDLYSIAPLTWRMYRRLTPAASFSLFSSSPTSERPYPMIQPANGDLDLWVSTGDRDIDSSTTYNANPGSVTYPGGVKYTSTYTVTEFPAASPPRYFLEGSAPVLEFVLTQYTGGAATVDDANIVGWPAPTVGNNHDRWQVKVELLDNSLDTLDSYSVILDSTGGIVGNEIEYIVKREKWAANPVDDVFAVRMTVRWLDQVDTGDPDGDAKVGGITASIVTNVADVGSLYYVTSFGGSVVWTDRTPTNASGQNLTVWGPFGLDADPLTNTHAEMLLSTAWLGGTKALNESDDEGANYSEIASFLDYRGLQSVASLALYYGRDGIGYSEDNGVTITDYTGDWADSMGTLGEIRNVRALL